MLFEIACNGYGIGTLTLHAYAYGLDSANQKKCLSGIHRTAKINDHVPDTIHPFPTPGGGAGDNVRVAAEIFGGAVNDHIETDFDGLLQDGRGEGIVNDRYELVFFCESDGFLKVNETQCRIGWGLDIQNFGAWGDLTFGILERG